MFQSLENNDVNDSQLWMIALSFDPILKSFAVDISESSVYLATSVPSNTILLV